MNFSRPKKIFIVDDDAMFSEAMSDFLTRDVAHHVTCFATGEDCIKNLENMTPEVIILDYYLNSVKKDAATGLEILQSIKHSYPSIKVIMLSSQDSYLTSLGILKGGANEYVIKNEKAFENVAKLIND